MEKPDATNPKRPPRAQSWHLSQEQLEVVRLWLEDQWTIRGCPFHGPTRWEIGDSLAQAPAFTGGNIVLPSPVYPVVVITCSICGYTVLINALKLNLIPRPEAEVVASSTGQGD